MKINLSTAFLLIPGLITVSCGSNATDTSDMDSEKLFHETRSLTLTYIDSLNKANDSTAVKGLYERFDNKLTELNFSVAADTDYRIDEGQNDTIAVLLDSIRRVYDGRLYRLGHPSSEQRNDSVTPEERVKEV